MIEFVVILSPPAVITRLKVFGRYNNLFFIREPSKALFNSPLHLCKRVVSYIFLNTEINTLLGEWWKAHSDCVKGCVGGFNFSFLYSLIQLDTKTQLLGFGLQGLQFYSAKKR